MVIGIYKWKTIANNSSNAKYFYNFNVLICHAHNFTIRNRSGSLPE